MEEQLKRIADALEGIETFLGNIENNLSNLNECIAYVPPRYHQNEGYYILRIGGQVETE